MFCIRRVIFFPLASCPLLNQSQLPHLLCVFFLALLENDEGDGEMAGETKQSNQIVTFSIEIFSIVDAVFLFAFIANNEN